MMFKTEALTKTLFCLIACVALALTFNAQTRQRRATTTPPDSTAQTQTSPPQTPSRNPPIPSSLPPPPAPPPRPTPTPEPEPTNEILVNETDEIKIVSKLVVVPVSVSDERGIPVKGLTAADFQLDERGARQQIAEVGDAEEIPLELALLLDVSSSVQGRFDFELKAADRFLRQVMKPADRVTLFVIDSAPQRLGVRMTIQEAIARLTTIKTKPDSFTAFFDTVVEAAEFLNTQTPPRTRRVIVCLSDGDDTYSERLRTRFDREIRAQQRSGEVTQQQAESTLKQTQAALYERQLKVTLPEVQRADAVFYAINPSGNSIYLNVAARRGQAGMNELSKATGGASFLPNVIEDLELVFNQIVSELRAQYLIQYYSNNSAATGEFLPIAVRTPARGNLRVRARQGYYSK